ncbi:hypothetical protein OsJ_34413 [Oryza sativa Japonica Group]|uniref:Uncharacterized protein n=2 Tax=Oryza sativa subsp. japonica TaxID=39947 RepID=A0A8J8XAQ4_ORYSJ|nr:hypothetical protein LOC_Os11g39040 [Oryza sativa Japonica Group]EAZ18874.1 hypothetical protein OsJ_34413 [Oryza sativa Japonica Group]
MRILVGWGWGIEKGTPSFSIGQRQPPPTRQQQQQQRWRQRQLKPPPEWTVHADDAAAAATTVDGDGGDENSKQQQQPSVNKLHMPQEYVDYILAWKKRPFPLPDDGEILSPEHREMRERMAATCNELGDGFEEFQAEVRREVEEKGFYEVDESYFANQAEIQAQLKDGPRSTGATSSSPTGMTSTTPIAVDRSTATIPNHPYELSRHLQSTPGKARQGELQRPIERIKRMEAEKGTTIVKSVTGAAAEEIFTEQEDELQALVSEEFAKIDLKSIKFGDWDYDDPTCCHMP